MSGSAIWTLSQHMRHRLTFELDPSPQWIFVFVHLSSLVTRPGWPKQEKINLRLKHKGGPTNLPEKPLAKWLNEPTARTGLAKWIFFWSSVRQHQKQGAILLYKIKKWLKHLNNVFKGSSKVAYFSTGI